MNRHFSLEPHGRHDVRYPVELRRAPDTDEEMTRRVIDLISNDEALKTAISGTPKIRSAIRG